MRFTTVQKYIDRNNIKDWKLETIRNYFRQGWRQGVWLGWQNAAPQGGGGGGEGAVTHFFFRPETRCANIFILV